MEPLVWKNRLVKLLDDHTWAMSRVGSHEDFDFAPDKTTADQAIAGTLGTNATILDMKELDEEHLGVWTSQGFFVFEGDPMNGGYLRLNELPKYLIR